MKPPRRYSTEAVVIRHLDFGEADRILTLYTPSLGKLRAIVKGVRRPRSRSTGHVDLFTRCKLMLAQGRDLDIVTQAEAIDHFPGLRRGVTEMAYASYVSELVDAFVPDRLPNSDLYAALLSILKSLEIHEPAMWVRGFELALLDTSGYRPELHICLACGKTIVPEVNRLSPSLGGILCESCGHRDPAAREVSIPALKLLRYLQTQPERVLGLESVDIRLVREVEGRLHEYIVHCLEKRPKSVAVLARIQDQLAAVGA